MKVEIKIPKVVFDASALEPGKVEKLAQVALNRIRTKHNAHFKSAENPDGTPFPKLSKDYADYKASRGRNPIRDLRLESHMLQGSNVRVVPNGAEYGFNPRDVEKARENDKRTPFHYFSASDEKIVDETWDKYLDKELSNIVKITRSR